MAKPFHKLLAKSLETAHQLAKNGILQAKQLKRADRERLQQGQCLHEVIKGWYILTRPGVSFGESTLWYASYWDFLHCYLANRFGKDYCLSAESSLALHLQSNTIPQQIIIILLKGGNSVLKLPHDTSLVMYEDKKKFPDVRETVNGIEVMPLALALARVSPQYFLTKESEIALKLIDKVEDVERYLLAEGLVQSAGRLAAAYRHIHDAQSADKIVKVMRSAGYKVEEDASVFEKKAPLILTRNLTSPYVGRIHMMWQSMREEVIAHFPKPELQKETEDIMADICARYVHDAYHSLSIEGYRVSPALIELVREGKWDPMSDPNHRQDRDAMAALGYLRCFQQVKEYVLSRLEKVGQHKVELPILDWYASLFSPSVEAGVLGAEWLVGFRQHPVYIRHARHVPPSEEALIDCMETFYTLLKSEENPAARAILGHFIFVYIHPFPDGNGRIGRFIMNSQLASAFYPWTIIRLENRQQYFMALESASVEGDIKPLVAFVAEEMAVEWS